MPRKCEAHNDWYYRSDGTRGCRPCRNEASRRWRKRNPEKAKRIDRTMDLKRRYGGMSIEEWESIASRGCAICGSMKHLCVDHDHATGRVRGCLCGSCNRGLGQFRDNKRTMLAAVEYLKTAELRAA